MREISKWFKKTFLVVNFYDSKCMLSGLFCIAGLTNKIIESVLLKKASLYLGCLPYLGTVVGRSCVEYRWSLQGIGLVHTEHS